MLDSPLATIVIATVLGFLAGLGVGGGSLLMLWLTLALNMDYQQARIINLIFFIPSAIVSCIFRWKQESIQLKKILPAIAAGCIGAAIASIAGRNLELDILKKFFGILLLLTGLRELFYKPKKG